MKVRIRITFITHDAYDSALVNSTFCVLVIVTLRIATKHIMKIMHACFQQICLYKTLSQRTERGTETEGLDIDLVLAYLAWCLSCLKFASSALSRMRSRIWSHTPSCVNKHSMCQGACDNMHVNMLRASLCARHGLHNLLCNIPKRDPYMWRTRLLEWAEILPLSLRKANNESSQRSSK